MRTAISLDKVDPSCAKILREKPTGEDSGFIYYSDIIYFSVSYTDVKIWCKMLSLGFKKLVRSSKINKAVNISDKYDILIVQS